MPRDHREGPITVQLSGDRARRLAERLLAPDADPAWDELATLAGPASRVSHDWDPATGRLTLAALG
jgi:hypothetical protein